MLRWGCGHTFYVKHLCGTTEIGVTIRDCGPHTDMWCGEKKCCSGKCASNRIIDLTPAAFSALGENAVRAGALHSALAVVREQVFGLTGHITEPSRRQEASTADA
ncbi:hypothetical protein ACFQ1S_03305 [Kibdelosporangium lantanae]|uniref:Uncharacterized protein n=1 Tax=Kibdelosporangium lantanae TaxID=1497396 RepID=A0ABW3M1W6_9PSEU